MVLYTETGEAFMVGGERHGVLGDPQNTSLTSDVSGNAGINLHLIILQKICFQLSKLDNLL